ncbi:MAG TPA: hypothetical protein VK777_20100 [Reyranella sp.]|jgi:hypothetical protein|nr:hypothetical protein [Reyranella sp.]
MTELRGWGKICGLALVGAPLISCSTGEPIKTDSRVVFVDPARTPQRSGHPDRVTIGMSHQQVEALMGPSRETCWASHEGAVERHICFRDGKVSSVSKLEHQPGKNQVGINGVFTIEGSPSPSDSAQVDGLAIGMSLPHVARMKGTPKAIVEEYYDGTSIYRATFMDGRLSEFRHIPPPPVY